MLVSVDAEKPFDKIQNAFMKMTFSNLKIDKNCLHPIKGIVPVINLSPLSCKFTLQYLLCDRLDSLLTFPLQQVPGTWPKEGARATLPKKDGLSSLLQCIVFCYFWSCCTVGQRCECVGTFGGALLQLSAQRL